MIKRSYLLIFFLFYVSCSFSQDKQNESTTNKELSVSYNLTSIVRRNYQYFFDERSIFPTSNQIYTIAPEIKLNHHFSCRFPVSMGIKHIKNGTEVNGYYPDVDFGYHEMWEAMYPYDVNQEPYYNSICNTSDPYSTIPGHSKTKKPYARPMDLVWQIGACPKWYFSDAPTKCNFYLAMSLNLARMDKYRIDCYNIMYHGENYWQKKDQTMIAYRNPFFVLRKEFLMGFDFKFGNHFHVDWEFGYSPFVKKMGKDPDRIYYMVNAGENVLIDEIYNKDDFDVMINGESKSIIRTFPFGGYLFSDLLIRYSF